MVQPYNYNIALGAPMEGALGGIKNALSIAQGIDTADAEKARADLYRRQTQGVNLDIAAKQSAAEQARVLQDDINNVVRTPSTEGITSLMLKYPHLSEGFNRGLNAVSTEEQKARVQEGTQIYAAILNDKIDVAKTILTDTATALRDKGNAKQAETYERMAQLIELNPDGSETTIGMMLSTAMGPEQFRATFKELEDQRRLRRGERAAQRKGVAEANEAESKAATAAVTAKFAESNATIDLKKKGWDITKLQNDVALSKLNQRIATLTAEESRATSTARREELQLKVQKLRDDRDNAVREVAATGMSAFSAINETQNLITDILGDEDSLRAALGASAWRGWMPGTETRTVAGKIGQLVDKLASANLDQLKGAMSDKDIAFLRNINSNLDRFQDEDQAIAEIKRIGRAMEGARTKLITRYGIPKSAPPGTKAAASEPDVSDW